MIFHIKIVRGLHFNTPCVPFSHRPAIPLLAYIYYNGVYAYAPSFPFPKILLRNSLFSSVGIKNFIILMKKLSDMFCRYVRTRYFCTRFRR